MNGGETLAALNRKWKADIDTWKKRKQMLDPKFQRKKNRCPKCNKEGYHVKMDAIGNKHVKKKITMYNVEVYRCPRCGFLDYAWNRIEGTGTKGINAGKEWGSK